MAVRSTDGRPNGQDGAREGTFANVLPQAALPPPRQPTKLAWHVAEIVESGKAHSGSQGGLQRVMVGSKSFEVGLRSLYIFPVTGKSPLSSFRLWVISFVVWKWFDRFILLCIFANSVLLAAYQYREDNKSGLNWFVDRIADPVFTVFYVLESIFKIIAWGLFVDRTSYLREPWNCLDFVVVVSALVEYLLNAGGGASFLRLFRVLRPLRSLHAVPQIKVLVNTVLGSIPRLGNVSVMGAFLFVVFGIIGTTLYHGIYFHGCRTIENPVLVSGDGSFCWSWPYTGDDRICGGRYQCKDPARGVEVGWCGGREDSPNMDVRPKFSSHLGDGKRGYPWCEGSEPKRIFPETEFINFDNIGCALLAVFQSMTLEGWVDIMYTVQDAFGLWVGTIYFLMLIFVTSFTLLNVALAVVDEAREEFVVDEVDMNLKIRADDADGGDVPEIRVDTLPSGTVELSHDGESTGQQQVVAGQGSAAASVDAVVPSVSSGLIQIDESVRSVRSYVSVMSKWFTARASSEEIWLDIAPVRFLRTIVLSEVYTNFIMLIIAANAVTISIDRYPPPIHLMDFLAWCETIFLILFTVEMLLLLLALGPGRYWTNVFTAFDGAIVIISWCQFFLVSGSGSPVTALRTLRLFRVLNKLASRWPSFRVLLKAIIQTAISLVYWFVLFILFLYIVTLASMSLFNRQFHFTDIDDMGEISKDQGEAWCGGIPGNTDCIPRAHFDTFLWALATVFQLMTGENWNVVMYAGMRANGGNWPWPWVYALFFISIILFGQLLFLSLFLSMLMSNFKTVQDQLEKLEQERLAEMKSKKKKTRAIQTKDRVMDLFLHLGDRSTKLRKISKVTPINGEDSVEAEEDGTDTRTTNNSASVQEKVAQAKVKLDVLGKFASFNAKRGSKNTIKEEVSPQSPVKDVSDSPDKQRVLVRPAPGSEPRSAASGCASQAAEASPEEQEERYRSAPKPWQADEPEASLAAPQDSSRPNTQERESVSVSLESVGDKSHSVSKNPENLLEAEVGRPDNIDEMVEEEDPMKDMQEAETIEQFATGLLHALENDKQKGWPHGYAWFLFPKDGLVCTTCEKILTHELCGIKVFDNAILFCILASCACMAADSPLRDPRHFGTKVIRTADKVFAVIFMVEMCLKLLAKGLIWGKGAYLHSGWNWLDGAVVSVSVISFASSSQSSAVKTLRILRAFRPLRVISRNENLKVVVQTIFASMPDLFTLVIVAFLILMIFALFGTSLLAGRLYHCAPPDDKGPVEEYIALAHAVGTSFVTPLCLRSNVMEAAADSMCPPLERGSHWRGSYAFEAKSWIDRDSSCDGVGAANCNNSFALAWQRASHDTPICIGRCNPNLGDDARTPPEELCPRRLTMTEELPSACPARTSDEQALYEKDMQERFGGTYLADEARGTKYVEAMQRSLVLPCGGSTVDPTSGTVVYAATEGSCARTFCPWVADIPHTDSMRESCRDNCRKRTRQIDFCVSSCDEGKDFSSPECESCLYECEEACLCEDFCEPLVKDAALCVEQGGSWVQQISQNFDNVGSSLLALFEISSTEGWVDVMYAASDSNSDTYMQPLRDGRELLFVPFFLIWMFFSHMFLINLSIGVIVDKFMDLKAAGKGIIKLTYQQQRWINARQNLFGPSAVWDMTNLHQLPKLRRKVYEGISHRWFENGIMVAIALNTLAMALKIYPSPTDWWDDSLEIVNFVFAFVFTVEAVLKIYALRWNYFKDNWNRFDFTCVVATSVGIFVRIVTSVKFATFTSVIRIFRIARLFRLLRFLKGLNKIFMALILAMPKLVYTLLILLLLLILYGILGVSLFSTAKHSETLNVHGNFQNFFWAFITLFRSSTGEMWNEIMHDLMKGEEEFFHEGSWCSPPELFNTEEVHGFEVLHAKCLIEKPNACVPKLMGFNMMPVVYWVTYTLFITIMVLNLLVAVILEGYDDGKPTPESEVVALCMKVWKVYDPDQTMWLPISDALCFIRDVQLLIEKPGKDVEDLPTLWSELQAKSEGEAFTEREFRIRETGVFARALEKQRKKDGAFRMDGVPLKVAKAYDVMRVCDKGKVHFLMATKQVLRFESADNNIDDFGKLEAPEDVSSKLVRKLRTMEDRRVQYAGASPGDLVTRVVAVTKIQLNLCRTQQSARPLGSRVGSALFARPSGAILGDLS